jgi:hypothetical protein
MKTNKTKSTVGIQISSMSGIRAMHNQWMEHARALGINPGPTFLQTLQPVPDSITAVFKKDK